MPRVPHADDYGALHRANLVLIGVGKFPEARERRESSEMAAGDVSQMKKHGQRMIEL